jgi:hypothetical protein
MGSKEVRVMPGKILVSCSFLVVTALLLCPITSHSAEVIDVSVTLALSAGFGPMCHAIDDEGQLWVTVEFGGAWYYCATYPGAVALDFGVYPDVLSVRGFIAYANGDLLPVYHDGEPWGSLIPGPSGASGIEEVSVRFADYYEEYDLCVLIREGCTVWLYIDGQWEGPNDVNSLPSETDPSTWGKIKAEFKE